MSDIKSEVIEHDGGWAYKIGDLISKRYPSRSSALIAGEHAAADYQAQRNIHHAADGTSRSIQKADTINTSRE